VLDTGIGLRADLAQAQPLLNARAADGFLETREAIVRSSRIHVCIIVLLASAAGTSAQMPSETTLSTETIVVDGSVNPELIPDWLAWQQVFGILRMVQGKDSSLHTNYAFAPADRELVTREVDNQARREQATIEKVEELRKVAAGLSVDEINERQWAITLAYRWTVLDARDRVLEGLSPDGLVTVQRLLADMRRSTRSIVPKSEYDMYRRPQ